MEDDREMPNHNAYLEYEWCQGTAAANLMKGLNAVGHFSLMLFHVQPKKKGAKLTHKSIVFFYTKVV